MIVELVWPTAAPVLSADPVWTEAASGYTCDGYPVEENLEGYNSYAEAIEC